MVALVARRPEVRQTVIGPFVSSPAYLLLGTQARYLPLPLPFFVSCCLICLSSFRFDTCLSPARATDSHSLVVFQCVHCTSPPLYLCSSHYRSRQHDPLHVFAVLAAVHHTPGDPISQILPATLNTTSLTQPLTQIEAHCSICTQPIKAKSAFQSSRIPNVSICVACFAAHVQNTPLLSDQRLYPFLVFSVHPLAPLLPTATSPVRFLLGFLSSCV